MELRLSRLVPRDERAGAALLALLLWLGGFELAPALHQGQHALLGAHSHGHAHASAPGPEADPEHDGDHGDGSLAHRGLSAASSPLGPAPFVAPSMVVDVV